MSTDCHGSGCDFQLFSVFSVCPVCSSSYPSLLYVVCVWFVVDIAYSPPSPGLSSLPECHWAKLGVRRVSCPNSNVGPGCVNLFCLAWCECRPLFRHPDCPLCLAQRCSCDEHRGWWVYLQNYSSQSTVRLFYNPTTRKPDNTAPMLFTPSELPLLNTLTFNSWKWVWFH